MSVYAIHKIGFFYTDDAFEASGEGTVVKIVHSLDEARKMKQAEDIASLKTVLQYDLRIEEFYTYHDKARELDKQLQSFLAENFPNQQGSEFYAHLSDEQAKYILNLLSLQFHQIAEYDDEESIDVTAFENDEEESELSEF
ncbi:hypothetical protein [Chitinophaga eiseniae]|uniref:Uncharacterized protein n=1 Tax=Chitinophaga eiseniae TaxID=634771 RepID=A0A847SI09_9BACT|nr:hypothetical protein [Chitinophaga eiseniae]NLR79383.1 hypothetical protein [Chitinophaga eiseniae]